MVPKASSIEVKNGGEGSMAERMPVAATFAPWTGLRGDFDRAINRFFPKGWPHMNVGSLMDFEPMRTLGGANLGRIMESARADVSETESSDVLYFGESLEARGDLPIGHHVQQSDASILAFRKCASHFQCAKRVLGPVDGNKYLFGHSHASDFDFSTTATR